MRLHFLALLPGTAAVAKLDARRSIRKTKQELRKFLLDANRECANYEPSPSPRYVRTNTLKRSWSIEGPYSRGKIIEGVVLSSGNIAPYNRFVRGPKKGKKGERQAERMAKRGWLSIDDIAAFQWEKHRGAVISAWQGR